jgi:hypothetical protein
MTKVTRGKVEPAGALRQIPGNVPTLPDTRNCSDSRVVPVAVPPSGCSVEIIGHFRILWIKRIFGTIQWPGAVHL